MESTDYFITATLVSSLTRKVPDSSVPMTLLVLCLRWSDVSLAQWLTALPPSDLCSKVTLLTKPLVSNLFKIAIACLPPSSLYLPFSTLFLSFAMICVKYNMFWAFNFCPTPAPNQKVNSMKAGLALFYLIILFPDLQQSLEHNRCSINTETMN